jgi:D-glycerate 3-kinase
LIGSKIMDAAAIQRFVMHFERLTRWNLETLPSIADLTLEIDRAHRFIRGSTR